jgi:hypothetical protein
LLRNLFNFVSLDCVTFFRAANNPFSAVVSGFQNVAAGDYGFIGAGAQNQVTVASAFV